MACFTLEWVLSAGAEFHVWAGSANTTLYSRWTMKVAIGSDHRGTRVVPQVAKILQELGHVALLAEESNDYPDVAFPVAGMVSRGEVDRAILLAASGMGMSIAANKVLGIRAVVCVDAWMAALSRRTFDANVLCLSAEMLGEVQLARVLAVWLATEFEGGRHSRRLEKIAAAERAQRDMR